MAYLTDAQCSYVCEQYPLWKSRNDIAADVNAMGGGTVKPNSVPMIAHRMGITRFGAIRPEPAERIPANYATVAAWAHQEGIPFASWDDIRPVNEARFKAGLPEFARLFDNPRCQPRQHRNSGETP